MPCTRSRDTAHDVSFVKPGCACAETPRYAPDGAARRQRLGGAGRAERVDALRRAQLLVHALELVDAVLQVVRQFAQLLHCTHVLHVDPVLRTDRRHATSEQQGTRGGTAHFRISCCWCADGCSEFSAPNLSTSTFSMSPKQTVFYQKRQT